jgi:hypothetical protein
MGKNCGASNHFDKYMLKLEREHLRVVMIEAVVRWTKLTRPAVVMMSNAEVGTGILREIVIEAMVRWAKLRGWQPLQ